MVEQSDYSKSYQLRILLRNKPKKMLQQKNTVQKLSKNPERMSLVSSTSAPRAIPAE